MKTIHIKAFWLCLISSIILLVSSFILPPIGEISPSVIQAVGEIFGFATLSQIVPAIRERNNVTIKHGETEIELRKENA